MKTLEKIGLILFSNIVLILAIILCLILFGWIEIETVGYALEFLLNDETSSKITIGVSIILMILAIKCIFFGADTKDQKTDGILMANDNGKLLISKETLENLVSSIAKGFEGAENISTKVSLDKENNLYIHVTLQVKENAVIKDLSLNLQEKIKEAIKKSSDLDVKEVNIKVKNIAPKKEENI
ncbi:MAG: alkaline shock response membrane anchor protein AmaP [Clostridia bacterium]|nr:alkaline shock response membrane anchor protein AmaP [Clostridia bacterium]